MNLLTHYDLDGAVCAILIRSLYPEIKVKGIGYPKLSESLLALLQLQEPLIITDLSLALEDVDKIKASKVKTLWIDHHESSQYLKNLSTDLFTTYVNTKFCGAANILKFFKGKREFSTELKRLAYYTNDYDLWIHKEIESSILNFIFWSRKFNSFIDAFASGYSESIVDSFREPYAKHMDQVKKHLAACDKYEFFEGKKSALLIFTDKYISDVSSELPEYDFWFIVSDGHKMSVRCIDQYNLTKPFDSIKREVAVESCGCHKCSGGINLIPDKFDDNNDIMDYWIGTAEFIMKSFNDPIPPF